MRYPVGKGSSPDDIWSKVEKRQKEALSRNAGGPQAGSPSKPTTAASPSQEGRLLPVDIILRKVSSLTGVWGLEKYGFIDLNCLKAMEGQEGVSDTMYTYVNERKGWVNEQGNLRSLLAERGQRLRGGLGGRPGQEGQTERVVQRVMESMLKKVLTWNEKFEAKLEKQKEREQFKLERQREREQKQREKRLELERMLDPSSFKVHWRNWGIPAPDASTATASMAACFMRLENLKKAVKLSSNQTFSLSMLNVEDQDTNTGAQDDDQDSEMARNLDAELNHRRETKSRRNWEVTSPRNRRGIGVTSYKEASDDDDDDDDENPSVKSDTSASDDEDTE